MNKLYCAGCCLVVLMAACGAETLPCCEPPTGGCYAEQCRIVNRTILNAVMTKTTCTVEVPVKKGYTVQSKDIPTEVPYTKMVPVCVHNPCTGRTRTEMRPQTVMQKATTTYIVVLPPDGPDTTRKEEKTALSLQVKIGHAPAQVVEKVPVPCCKKCH